MFCTPTYTLHHNFSDSVVWLFIEQLYIDSMIGILHVLWPQYMYV